MSKRGLFVVFEGLDRCGKSTQSDLLFAYLNDHGKKVSKMNFPARDTNIGGIIDEYLTNKTKLDDRVVHLLFSANRWEKMDEVEAQLKKGTTVVCDRYAYSGVAFSAAKCIKRKFQGLDLEWCKAPDAGLLCPDVVFFLSMSVEEAARRGGFGKERYEKLEFQTKVNDMYAKLHGMNWKVIDAQRSKEEIQQEINKHISVLLEQETLPELEKLWK